LQEPLSQYRPRLLAQGGKNEGGAGGFRALVISMGPLRNPGTKVL
jgi:hypothetical protein